MRLLTTLALASTFLLVSLSHAQQSADIGLMFSNVDYGQLTLDFRKPINDKLRWNVAVSLGGDNGFSTSQIESATADSIFYSTTFISADQQTLRFGVARKISDWNLYLRLDGLVGHRVQYFNQGQSLSVRNEDGEWMLEPLFDFDNNKFAQTSRRFIVPGLQLALEADLPIKGRFSLAVQLASRLQTPVYLEDFDTNDPNGIYSRQPSTSIDLDLYAAVGLRYGLGKKIELGQ